VHSGSGVAGTDFIDLAQRLDPEIRFFGIQAPAIRMGDAAFGKTLESLAEHYVDALVESQPRGPILLGGYCVGAVIAMVMANSLRARGRVVGPIVAIDGAPENTGVASQRWRPKYWLDLACNVPRWIAHGDLMRSRSLHSFAWSLSNNASAIAKVALGLRRGEKIGGGYDVEGIMDVSRYQPSHRSFVNRLFGAALEYTPAQYEGEVVVYEATVTPLLYSPQIGRIWRTWARKSHVVPIVGTHIGIMHPPYVDALAADLKRRLVEFFRKRPSAA
jgi:thioesterase domain-containing protein